jgi:hypothetical protein
MAKVLDKVVAIRLEGDTERALRQLAREDDRTLASWLRRRLRELVAAEGTERGVVARTDA